MKRDLTDYMRGVIVSMMAATAMFMLLSGVGTTCLAFNAVNMPPPNGNLAEYALFYQAAVFLYLIIGFITAITTYAFIRGEKWAFNVSLVALVVGGVYSIIHVYLSRTLRGASLPNDVRLVITLATLVVLLIIRSPWIWSKIDLTKAPEGDASYSIPTGVAFLTSGVCVFLVPMMSTASHTINGINYISYLQPQLNIVGGILTTLGAGLLLLLKLGINPDNWVVTAFNRLAPKTEARGAK